MIANAKAMGEELQRAGLRLVGGGTDTHLLLVDLSAKGLTGKAVEAYLDEIGITVNKNAIPFDPQKPMVDQRHPHRHAGDHVARVRARTTRARSASIIGAALDDLAAREKIDALRDRVHELTGRFGVP